MSAEAVPTGMDESQPPPDQTLAAAGHRKHQAMLERLSKRATATSSSSSDSSTAAFLSRFADSKRAIESSLSHCRAAAAAGGGDSNETVKTELDRVAAAIADLDRLLAENSYSLPSYEVRAALRSIAELKDALEVANAELLPRKRFSFRNKASRSEKGAVLAAPAREIGEANDAEAENSNLAAPARPIGETADPGKERSGLEAVSAKNSGQKSSPDAIRGAPPGFRSEKGATLVKDFKVSEESEGDFTLADLDSCKIYLKGKFRALFVHRLRNCRVFVGPVLGSVLIEDAKDCLFVIASHQIRIHEARATDFYLRVRSRPIIEDSSGVRFAPYALVHKGMGAELRDSGLAEETGNWANVDDFKWLRATQSPNWCLIPEEERLRTIDISELKEQPVES